MLGTIDLVAELDGKGNGAGPDPADERQAGSEILEERQPHAELAGDPRLPADTRLWAALQAASGGTWGGCVYDTDCILELLEAGERALSQA